ncbi:MAG: hypothetical protein H7039_05390 [Bryobacteraceae bacterium]|nr:hypothetical protein [Bryobacteraceae bacterium]
MMRAFQNGQTTENLARADYMTSHGLHHRAQSNANRIPVIRCRTLQFAEANRSHFYEATLYRRFKGCVPFNSIYEKYAGTLIGMPVHIRRDAMLGSTAELDYFKRADDRAADVRFRNAVARKDINLALRCSAAMAPHCGDYKRN